jgi:adenylate kinase
MTTFYRNQEMKKGNESLSSSNSEHRRVLIVTGTPGVGKSSVSRQLSSRLHAELVSIGDLVREEGLYVRADRKRDTLVADMEKVSNRINNIILHSSEMLVIEGHYAVDVVPTEAVKLVFVLRRDPGELRKILRSRGYEGGKVNENIAAEVLDVCLYDAVERHGTDKVCEIDVTGRKTGEVTEEIMQVLRGERRCRIKIVDWLGKLYSEGKLDDYLKEF